jgi:hypothetical protein
MGGGWGLNVTYYFKASYAQTREFLPRKEPLVRCTLGAHQVHIAVWAFHVAGSGAIEFAGAIP